MTDKKEPYKLVFAPGCFDGFEGSQEELDALIKEIQGLVDSGEIFEKSQPLDEEGMAELEEQMMKQMGRNVQ